MSAVILAWTFASLALVAFASFVRDRPRDWLTVFASGAVLAAAILTAGLQTAIAQVAPASAAHRVALQVEARRLFGPAAPVARFAAQVQQESAWRPDAASRYAHGLAQFTPATAEWIATAYPECSPANVWSERWALRCLVRYDRHLWERIKPLGSGSSVAHCDRWAMTLAAYNGGAGWINRDRRAAAAVGLDPNRWAGHVATVSHRAAWAFEENRGYPRRILGRWEPAYLRAGWPGDGIDCSGAAS